MMSALIYRIPNTDMMSARYAFGDQHDAQSFCLKHYFF
ncbi:hypothetical protein LTSEADE_1639 [Salmonella enterica subsp. enterica serovar Adelaide str. A4-669]|uniref:Uncharacterized protein n=2 Tax=Salmonella enterica I TaxID=59201 RepID=A0A6C8GQM2_SALET|nr:hypothetical protein LTSEADE_1639 [Salmonella enterica subsp. enterica serovar Adelaide str. A4-669]EHD04903.1 hypothetical protein LTSEURB_1622 [Salmonella enterica subsp. enterica serovar Urbana str. R8-2977]EHJ83294.1 hypothetical protein LTSEBAI_1709 [Salmonella enterica subsp. enterica serovar Baildon str. R6-199]